MRDRDRYKRKYDEILIVISTISILLHRMSLYSKYLNAHSILLPYSHCQRLLLSTIFFFLRGSTGDIILQFGLSSFFLASTGFLNLSSISRKVSEETAGFFYSRFLKISTLINIIFQ